MRPEEDAGLPCPPIKAGREAAFSGFRPEGNPIMQKRLYLDIDGVLVAHQPRAAVQLQEGLSQRLAAEKGDPRIAAISDRLLSQFLAAFDAGALDRVRRLQNEFNLEIVLTSSWRVLYSLDFMQALFHVFDLELDRFLPQGFPRSSLILADAAGAGPWIAIDDMDMRKQLGHHQILTDNVLSEADYEKARRQLLVQ